ncbi:MAG: Rieske 2Fe-2S domain-containing protein [Polyangiales bacterium]
MTLPPFPDGWFALAFSEELAVGSVLTRRAFGEEVVLFRGTDGVPAIVEAYCPHMGAHLGHGGRVEENTIRCPFHGFRFARDGGCVHAYGGKPPRAKLRTFPVAERSGVVFAWHHAKGEAPAWQPPELDRTGWTEWRHETIPIRTHVQETAENSVDIGHFAAVHGYRGTEMVREIGTDGALLTIGLKSARSLASVGMEGEVEFVYDIAVHGLGCSVVEVDVATFGVRSRQLVLATPTDEHNIELRVGASLLALADPAATEGLFSMLFRGFIDDVRQDVPIWENKRYVERPLLAAGDGPIPVYRRWAQQFYSS